MRKIKTLLRLFVVLLLVGGWGLAASALHVIWTGEKVNVMSKDRLGVRDTYVDTSKWTVDDVAARPALAKRLIATGRADALSKAMGGLNGTELVTQIEAAIERGPTTKPAPSVNDHVADAVEQVSEKAGQAAAQIKGAVQ